MPVVRRVRRKSTKKNQPAKKTVESIVSTSSTVTEAGEIETSRERLFEKEKAEGPSSDTSTKQVVDEFSTTSENEPSNLSHEFEPAPQSPTEVVNSWFQTDGEEPQSPTKRKLDEAPKSGSSKRPKVTREEEDEDDEEEEQQQQQPVAGAGDATY